MKLTDKFKLGISRNWKFPGQIRMLKYLKPSTEANTSLKDGIIWLESENLAIFTTSDNYIENAILTTGTYESEIQKLISISLKPGDVCLDIGCNIGLQSMRMGKVVGPSGRVIAFEPLQYLRRKSRKNFDLNLLSTIQVLPYALSDEEGSFDLAINENIYNQGTFSLLQEPSGNTIEKINVKVGDELENIQLLTKLDLIKIDVEGFEYNVIRGLKTTITRHKPRLIFEYDKNYWRRNNQDIHSCYELLNSIGYSIYQISFLGCELIRTPTQIKDGNLFCVTTMEDATKETS